jgi:GT2 family glycosyltransferase
VSDVVVDIVVPTLNQAHLAVACFQSIARTTRRGQVRVIWVDNGSERAERNAMCVLDEVESWVLWLPENIGFVKATNAGIAVSTAPYVLLLNNDTELPEGWLPDFLDVFEKYPDVGLVGPWARPAAFQWQSNRPRSRMAGTWPDQRTYILEPTRALGFWCTMIRRKVIEDVGYLSEEWGLGWGDDDDYCYDELSQVVTRGGIKFFKDVRRSDELLTLRDDGWMEYQQPTRLIAKKADSELLHFRTRRLDLMVSPEQQLLVGYRYPSKGIDRAPDFVRADQVNSRLWKRQGRYFVKKNGGDWLGYSPATVPFGDKEFQIEPLVELIAWFSAEGHVDKTGEIRIAQSPKNADNRERIADSMRALGLEPRIRKREVACRCRQLVEELRWCGPSHERRVPLWLRELDRGLLRLFLETYMRGDGTRKKGGMALYTSSHWMRDDLVEMILKIGGSFSYSLQGGGPMRFTNGKEYDCRPVWHIQTYSARAGRALLQKARLVPCDGWVYDVTVPNRRIYVIRNGKGCWSSNCARAQLAGWKLALRDNVEVLHHGGKSFDALPTEELDRRRTANLERLKKKWGTWYGGDLMAAK